MNLPSLHPALLLFMLAACVQLPPTPQDMEAKRFEPVPGKAVIYVVRSNADLSYEVSTVMLDGQAMGSTYVGTYFRWVVESGRHEIRGFAGDNGSIVLDVAPDRLYFVQQSVSRFVGPAQSFFRLVAEPYGREAVLQAKLTGG
jgi:hypothetical protein